ncbi:thioredoxin family protein [Flavobacterium kingsejongi]|uniref:Thioredoxin family protein n=1 Tax=Flavobacterium kingsejongi TaxID=1678728 RepID=A0A2S1LMN2_9FLAO|nr:thioredoxin family protein [Flavobacterium kingsejongi]AWG24941.1 thioredoxin family protein [Flavobacterium kingsejongi]
MKAIIEAALAKSMNYIQYRNLVSTFLAEGKATGPEQSEALVHYSSLNDTRMKRLDKTMVVTEAHTEKILGLEWEYIWLVLTEGWCGDAAQIVPILNKMAAIGDKIDLKIVLRDENEALMNLFLTNGGKSIPKLILLDAATLDVLADWGPRPAGAQQLIQEYKEKFGVIDDTLKTELQLWYHHDKGVSTQNEVLELLS